VVTSKKKSGAKKSAQKKSAAKVSRKKSVSKAPKSGKSKLPSVQVRNKPLRSLTEEALQKYFKDLSGTPPKNLYNLVIGEVEAPLLQSVMEFTEGNQTIASDILGINRATLRKKLKQYKLI